MLIERKYIFFVPTLIFAFLLMAGLAVSIISLKTVSWQDWVELGDPEKILTGESTKRFTKLLNQYFVAGGTFNHIERGILWNVTGDLGPSARAGCPGWLFLTDELEVHPDRIKSAEFRATLASQFDGRLKDRGIKLIMVVVPDKTRIESSHLCALHRSTLFDKRVVNWVGRLKLRGVESLDLAAALASAPSERYYRTDTHWNETGANAAALAVASKLSALKWASLAETGTVTPGAKTKRVERSGDLVHLAGLDGLPSFLRPKVELVQSTVVPPVAAASDDLFGDAGLPTIALVGTSYSRTSNFIPFLERHIGAPVANLAKDGGNYAGAAADFFASATLRDNPPKIVIWEVPERVIEMPVKDEERKWLENLAKAGR